jgi:hypothetical protein
MDKNGKGRVEDRKEPSVVASVQAGHLDQMMRDAQKYAEIGVQTPVYIT